METAAQQQQHRSLTLSPCSPAKRPRTAAATIDRSPDRHHQLRCLEFAVSQLEAERELERALELDCDNGAARANLARLRSVREAGDAERSVSNGG